MIVNDDPRIQKRLHDPKLEDILGREVAYLLEGYSEYTSEEYSEWVPTHLRDLIRITRTKFMEAMLQRIYDERYAIEVLYTAERYMHKHGYHFIYDTALSPLRLTQMGFPEDVMYWCVETFKDIENVPEPTLFMDHVDGVFFSSRSETKKWHEVLHATITEYKRVYSKDDPIPPLIADLCTCMETRTPRNIGWCDTREVVLHLYRGGYSTPEAFKRLFDSAAETYAVAAELVDALGLEIHAEQEADAGGLHSIMTTTEFMECHVEALCGELRKDLTSTVRYIAWLASKQLSESTKTTTTQG